MSDHLPDDVFVDPLDLIGSIGEAHLMGRMVDHFIEGILTAEHAGSILVVGDGKVFVHHLLLQYVFARCGMIDDPNSRIGRQVHSTLMMIVDAVFMARERTGLWVPPE